MDDLKELTHRLNEYEATILRMNQERAALFEEAAIFSFFVRGVKLSTPTSELYGNIYRHGKPR